MGLYEIHDDLIVDLIKVKHSNTRFKHTDIKGLIYQAIFDFRDKYQPKY
jgi:hypothetical protein